MPCTRIPRRTCRRLEPRLRPICRWMGWGEPAGSAAARTSTRRRQALAGQPRCSSMTLVDHQERTPSRWSMAGARRLPCWRRREPPPTRRLGRAPRRARGRSRSPGRVLRHAEPVVPVLLRAAQQLDEQQVRLGIPGRPPATSASSSPPPASRRQTAVAYTAVGARGSNCRCERDAAVTRRTCRSPVGAPAAGRAARWPHRCPRAPRRRPRRAETLMSAGSQAWSGTWRAGRRW